MTERKDFYSPGQIRFSRYQVIWLIKHLDLLLDLVWPSDHKETGYTGKKGRQRGHVAYFEKPAQIMAELSSRLERVGRDSLPLLIAYSKDPEQQYYTRALLATCLRIDVTELDRRIENALRYITGKCPRWVDCPGHPKCPQCKSCPKHDKCTRQPRQGRTYKQFCQHKRGNRRS